MNRLDLSDDRYRLLPRMLSEQARQVGAAPYLITDERRLSFAESEELANRIAGALRDMGISRGDRVAFYLENGWESVLVALALNKLGALWVPINTDYRGAWLRETIERSRCRMLITDVSLQDRVLDIEDALQGLLLVVNGAAQHIRLRGAHAFDTLCAHAPLTPDYAGMHCGDTCAILWTSGTTGKSKGVLQSHNSWIRPIADSASIYFGSRPGDVIYNVLPLFNSAAWVTAIFRGLYEGLPVVIEKRFGVNGFWDRIRHFGATQTFTLGAMHLHLWNAPARADDRDNPLRVAQMVPMPEALRRPFSERFGVELLPCGLGQSECMGILVPTYHLETMPFAALGHPLPDTEFALLDDDDRPVADGDPGEICIKALRPHVLFNGYFDDEKATAEAYRSGWYHTGDLAKRVDGHYWFVDRKKDALRYAGRNISSVEVEAIVRRHPSVREVAAFGIPSQQLAGESELALHVVLEPQAQLAYEELAGFINDNAPYYFVPQYMEFVAALPYTPTNKVQKYLLRERGVTPTTWKLKGSAYQVKR